MAILEVHHLEKTVRRRPGAAAISASLWRRGQALSIIGASGSGKTTLLRCLNFFWRRRTGGVHLRAVGPLFSARRTATTQQESAIFARSGDHFGLVFQSFNLLPQYTALPDVTLARELPGQGAGRGRPTR